MSKNSNFSKIIQDLDEKINSCISDISSFFDGVENIDKDLSILYSDDDFSEEFYSFLQKLNDLLSQSSRIAEFILPHFDELRKQNSIPLIQDPSFQQLKCHYSETKEETRADKILPLWYNICSNLETHIFSVLSQNYVTNLDLNNALNLSQLKKCILHLQSIFVPELVWKKYSYYRYQYLKQYKCPCPNVALCFNCCVRMCIKCIFEDHFLTYTGCFHPHIVTQANILQTYVDIIDQKFYDLLKQLPECLKLEHSLPQKIVSTLSSCLLYHNKYSKACLTCFFQANVDSEILCVIDSSSIHCHVEKISKNIFIRVIIKIIEIILWLENQMNELFYDKESESQLFHQHNDEYSNFLKGTKFILPAESPEQSPFSKSSQEKFSRKHQSSLDGEKISVIWNWRLTIVESGYLSYLQKSLQNEVEFVLKTSIENDKILLKTNNWKELFISDAAHFENASVQMNTLLYSVFNTVQSLEKYLAVLLTKCDSFISFKSSFCHTLDTYVIDLVKHLKEIANPSENFSINCVHIAVNNAVFLKDRLQNYCDALKGPGSECPQNNICLAVTQLVQDLLDSAYFRHYKYLNCGVLFDADSFNFQDPKPFFEDERISYSIQAWNLYMKGLHHDLSYQLPKKIAQELYGRLLADSIEHFLVRYSHCSPSEARTPQIQRDINVLLLCVSELLWPSCNSVSQYIGTKQEMDENGLTTFLNKIHNSCCFLFAILVILTSPINHLYESFKNGFPQAQLSTRTKYESASPWLLWTRTELFPDFSQWQTNSSLSVWLAVKVCTSWNLPNPPGVMKAFTEQNCTLSTLLMMEIARNEKKEDANLLPLSNACKAKLAHSLIELMVCCNNSSFIEAILLPVIDKENGWKEFDISTRNVTFINRSWWYIGLLRTFRSYFKDVVESLAPFWIDVSSKIEDRNIKNSWKEISNNFKQNVTCLCDEDPLNILQEDFELSDEYVSFLCLRNVLKNMLSHLLFLPSCLKYFLLSLDSYVKNYIPEIQPFENSVPLQILLLGLTDFLKDTEQISITAKVKSMAIMTSKSLAVFVCETDFFDEIHTEEIKVLLSSIHEHFLDMKENLESNKTKKNLESQDEILDLSVGKLLQLTNGDSIISYLHKIMLVNVSWIQRSLGIPNMLSSNDVVNSQSRSAITNSYSEFENDRVQLTDPNNTQKEESQNQTSCEIHSIIDTTINKGESFDSGYNSRVATENALQLPVSNQHDAVHETSLDLEVDESINQPQLEFNPLDVFDSLGESSFTQIAKEQPRMSWDVILSHIPILGLTEVNFCTLLSHRWDIRKEGPLNEEEINYVEELKAIYKMSI